MKKIIAAASLSLIASAGLVATTVTPAAAACAPQYETCSDVVPNSADATPKKKAKVQVQASFKFADGSVDRAPAGKIRFACAGPGGRERTIVRFVQKNEGISSVSVTKSFKPRGSWTCSVAFIPSNPERTGPASTSLSFNNR